jgi:hypothetical protein
MTRRDFVKGITVVGSTGVAVYAGRYLIPPSPRFQDRTSGRTLGYVVPHSGEEIQFVNETDEPFYLPPVDYSWSIDGKVVSGSRVYSSKLSETKSTGTPHTVELSGYRSSVIVNSVRQTIDVDPEIMPEYPAKRFDIPIKGVNYRAAALWGWYPSEAETRECMWVTKNELGCNGILISGADDSRILQVAEIAAQQGIETILLSPRAQREDFTIEEHVSRIIEFSKSVEEFRKKTPGTVLGVGNELTVDVMGILEGSTYDERTSEWEAKGWEYQKKLDDYLAVIVEGVREHYTGKMTYVSAIGEGRYVHWGELGFDIMAPHLYPGGDYWTDERILERIQIMRGKYRMPLWISEFGCATYRGATADGASSNYVNQDYDQSEQANAIVHDVNLFQKAKVDGLFLWTLFWPMQIDAASYGIMQYVGTPHGREEDPSTRLKRKLGFYAYKSYVH